MRQELNCPIAVQLRVVRAVYLTHPSRAVRQHYLIWANRCSRTQHLISSAGLTPEIDRAPGITEPRLPDMTRAALATLEKNQQGFFLMIEGSQVDWANHDNNYNYQYGEMVAFDESVKTVLDWINASDERKQHTLLIITADHETGGFAVGGGEGVPLGIFEPAWVTGDHTGGDIVTWSQGPGSEFLGKSIDNTEIYEIMRYVLK